jgi:hypothetical protein
MNTRYNKEVIMDMRHGDYGKQHFHSMTKRGFVETSTRLFMKNRKIVLESKLFYFVNKIDIHVS